VAREDQLLEIRNHIHCVKRPARQRLSGCVDDASLGIEAQYAPRQGDEEGHAIADADVVVSGEASEKEEGVEASQCGAH